MQQARRSFIDNIGAWIVGLFTMAGTAAAATRVKITQITGNPSTLAGFDPNGTGQSVTVGAGLQLANGTLSATAPPSARQYNIRLTYDSVSSTWPIPSGARNKTLVRRNGLGQVSPDDYAIVSNAIVPASGASWQADDQVVVDGE